jgi:hypothetical protein
LPVGVYQLINIKNISSFAAAFASSWTLQYVLEINQVH